MEQQRSAESETKTRAETTAATGDRQSPARLRVPSPRSNAVGDKVGTPGAPASSPRVGASVATAAGGRQRGDNKITIDDFLKVELRVGEVKVAEKVKGADKLLRHGSRYRHRSPADRRRHRQGLRSGKAGRTQSVIVANLQPRKLRGLESNGMIVAASLGDEGQPVLAGFLEDVPVGAKLK